MIGVCEFNSYGVKPDGSVVVAGPGSSNPRNPVLGGGLGWNLGSPNGSKLPRVPHGRDRCMPWPPADWKPKIAASAPSMPAEARQVSS